VVSANRALGWVASGLRDCLISADYARSRRGTLLYICIPVHNEAPTIGVLLWKIRGALQDFARDYELVVYDDASTDVTAEVLEPYTRVLPLTVLTGTHRRGYGAALDALARYVAAHTRYPRRDAMIVMQGDFTDRPEHIPELVKRFEGGADIVVTERQMRDADPAPVRRLRKLAPWILRPFLRVEGVPDPTSTYRLIRISVLRDALRDAGDRALVSEAGTAANAELLSALAPHYRRVESVPVEPRYDVRPRESRVRALADALALARFGWRNRKPGAAAARPLAAAPIRPSTEPPEPIPPRRRDEPELAVAETPGDGEPTRRRKRARREERPDTATAGPPPERSMPRERPPRRQRAAEPTEPATELPTPADVVAEASESPAAPARKRRKSRRRSRAEGEVAASTEEAQATAGSATETEAPASAESEGAAEGPTPTRARRRRSRRKRASAAGEAGAATEASVSDGAGESAGATAAEPSGDGDEARAEEGASRTGRSRRSRRGRRRGGRGSAIESGDAGASAGESPAPAPTSADAP
jgi:hypothetical protein